ncbi:MAG: response regulator [Aestuariibacter sp.]
MPFKDTGIGISTEQQLRLFNPFNQADGSINRRFGGSGLGLSISQALAQGLGGGIDVLSQEGIGSKFTLVLPLNEAAGCRWIDSYENISLGNTQKSANTSQPLHFCNARVLLAEDHPNNRDLICLLLKKMSIEVVAVEDGKQACDEALHQCFDLILMDIQMPVMDGLQALKKIRSFDPQTPIIALTANSMKHEIEHYIAAGFNDHLPKPIPKDILVKLLSDYLTTEQQSEATTPEDKDEMIGMIRDYIVILQAHLQDARSAWEHRKLDEFQEIAHKIKGSAGAFGFAKLGMQFDEIVQLIKSGQQEQLSEKVQQVLAQSDIFLNVPGADLATGLRNHSMDIEEYHQELLAFSQHSATMLLKLRTAIQNDVMLAVPLLQRLILQLQRMAFPRIVLLSQQLKELLEQDAAPDNSAKVLAEIEQQLDKITQFYQAQQ